MHGDVTTYDRIGVGYAQVRRPDPRLAALIRSALGDAKTLVNVGAGTGSYEPEIRHLERSRFAPLAHVVDTLKAHTVEPFPIPWDFSDGYQAAFWRRPEAYLDPVVRAASSTFASLPGTVVEPAMTRLRRDLRSGVWHGTTVTRTCSKQSPPTTATAC